ncbi:MAG: pyridine nucleotide-disulfide oxidoreductase, partial [Oscillospiraceae bacterium]|nr:pyridine nucleotide-disulfide oxidoreductase [Oscillospiraceae bacterium]
AGSANKQGRVAGCNAAGGNMLFKGVLGTAIIKAGKLACGVVGLSEKECIQEGLEYDSVYLYTNSSAAYYPAAKSLVIKLVYEKATGRILGAQAVGGGGVDKRIDVYSTAIYGGMSVFDLENLDLAYAPPFGSAKDPVIMSGMVASNAMRGVCSTVSPFKLKELLKAPDTVLLDVRTKNEFDAGALEGAVNIPVDELRRRIGELDRSKRYLIYCGVGYRAYLACRILTQKGFDVRNVSGGYYTATMDL